jgi:hypothetical protein
MDTRPLAVTAQPSGSAASDLTTDWLPAATCASSYDVLAGDVIPTVVLPTMVADRNRLVGRRP